MRKSQDQEEDWVVTSKWQAFGGRVSWSLQGWRWELSVTGGVGSVPQPACGPLRRGAPALWTLRFAVGVSLPRLWPPGSKTFLPGALQQEEAVGRSIATADISSLSFFGLTWAETAQELVWVTGQQTGQAPMEGLLKALLRSPLDQTIQLHNAAKITLGWESCQSDVLC